MKNDIHYNDIRFQGEEYVPMIVLNSQIPQGHYREYIASFTNPVVKDMALAEFFFFSGNQEKASPILAKHLDYPNPYIKLTAWLIYSFSNLTLGKVSETRRGIGFVNEFISSDLSQFENTQIKALWVLVSNAANVLIDLQIPGVPRLNEFLNELPTGLRLFGGYIMAHQAYLDGEYAKGLGIVETSLAFDGEKYIIASIFLNLAGAMNAMSLEDVNLGKKYFTKAYELAREDGLFEPIGEHHGLLQGLIETCLKKNHKEDYDKIIEITYKFSYGWRCIHNPITHGSVADTLTTTEFSIAMLANRGWTNNEIAEYMGLNVNTVKTHITSVFTKLNISNRKQLKEYMLK